MRAENCFNDSRGGKAVLKFEGFGWHTPALASRTSRTFNLSSRRKGKEGRRFGS